MVEGMSTIQDIHAEIHLASKPHYLKFLFRHADGQGLQQTQQHFHTYCICMQTIPRLSKHAPWNQLTSIAFPWPVPSRNTSSPASPPNKPDPLESASTINTQGMAHHLRTTRITIDGTNGTAAA
jgi:hypothetical protein